MNQEHEFDTISGISENSRNFARVGDSLLVSYTAVGDDVAWAFCETYDIGSGGIAIITNVELQDSDKVKVKLELRGDSRPAMMVNGVVRWSRLDPLLQKYRTGIEFEDMDREAEMNILRYVDTLRMLRDMGVL